MKNKVENQRGEMASNERNKNQNKENKNGKKALIYIKYLDHVLFRNCNSSKIKPSLREAVGWITFENQDIIRICTDMPVQLLPNEKIIESGLVIIKNSILEKFEIDFGNQFKLNTIGYSGQN